MKMTDREYVIRGCEIKGLDLIKPTKGSPGILVLGMVKNASGLFPIIADANTWKSARQQLDAWHNQS